MGVGEEEGPQLESETQSGEERRKEGTKGASSPAAPAAIASQCPAGESTM